MSAAKPSANDTKHEYIAITMVENQAIIVARFLAPGAPAAQAKLRELKKAHPHAMLYRRCEWLG